ncbi:hypothetical protein EJ08DRAFT_730943 [Tothia fuscella]|uniref:Uncharacterized protein n=1 Tax=Tothia fuscella TaxID=1048955 RepID=A0A9P4U134_9PEZI|nr:hypothetical protein EJ08DRAFT_730943 [Tothia fuscella]
MRPTRLAYLRYTPSMRTCHQIHYECAEILYGKNELILHHDYTPGPLPPPLSFIAGPLNTDRKFVREITIDSCHIDGTFDFVDETIGEPSFLDSHFPLLKTMRYVVRRESAPWAPQYLPTSDENNEEYMRRVEGFVNDLFESGRKCPKSLQPSFLDRDILWWRCPFSYPYPRDENSAANEAFRVVMEVWKASQAESEDGTGSTAMVVLRSQCPEDFLKKYNL